MGTKTNHDPNRSGLENTSSSPEIISDKYEIRKADEDLILKADASIEIKEAKPESGGSSAVYEDVLARSPAASVPEKVTIPSRSGTVEAGDEDAADEKKTEAAGQTWRDELKMREFSDDELLKTAEDDRKMVFRAGDGRMRTYAEAQQEMVDGISASIDRLRENGRNISMEQQQAILSDVQRTLLAQQTESQSRGIGNHGIPHLFGVYERMMETPDEVLEQGAQNVRVRYETSGTTAEDMRLGMALAAVYHDEGYLSEQARRGVNLGGYDKLHGVDSAIVFEKEHAPLYSGVLDDAVLSDVTQAIAVHNGLNPKDVERAKDHYSGDDSQSARLEMLSRINTHEYAEHDPNQGLIRSALLLSDKAGIDADEKVPDVLRNAETASIMTEYYTMHQRGMFTDQERETVAQEMRERMSAAIRNSSELSENQKNLMLESVEKDFGVNSGAFNQPLSSAAVSRNALRFSLTENGDGQQTINAQLTLEHRLTDPNLIGSFTAMPEEGKSAQEAKKLHGAMGDLGIVPDPEKEKALWRQRMIDEGKDPDDPENQMPPVERKYRLIDAGDGKFEVDTSEVTGLSNVTVILETVDADSVKIDPSSFEQQVEQTMEKMKEARAESENIENAHKMLDQFIEKQRAGLATSEDMLELCGSAYESQPEEAEQIAAEIEQTNRMDEGEEKQLRLQQLAERCTKLKIMDPNTPYDIIRKGAGNGN